MGENFLTQDQRLTEMDESLHEGREVEQEMGVNFMTEAQRLAEVEKLRQEMLQKARESEQLAREEKLPRKAKELERLAVWYQRVARIIDFDVKQDGLCFSRAHCVSHETFDFNDESPIGPMRYTDRVKKNGQQRIPCTGVNILTVKIASSDIGFPIRLYGTVIVRDSVDKKCIYLFHRDRNHCQLINSKDESLMLTGPKRGLLLLSDVHVEIDLMVKDDGAQDRELSKGYVCIQGMSRRSLKKCEIETESLASRLSTVNVMCAVVKRAMEGVVAIEVLQGNFHGEITAHTTSIKDSLVLYDSKVTGCIGNGVLQLMRHVICVYEMDMLIIVVQTSDGKYERVIEFTPNINNPEEDAIFIGATKMLVKVAWGIMDL